MSNTKYFQGTGRRKTAVARVRITPSSKQTIRVNDKELVEFFKTLDLQNKVVESFAVELIGDQKFEVTAKVVGGGSSSQAEAVRHGIARALESFDKNLRAPLKKSGFLTRDQRAKERRKFGLKKARKAPQWSKR